jgi:hypothetical protein
MLLKTSIYALSNESRQIKCSAVCAERKSSLMLNADDVHYY